MLFALVLSGLAKREAKSSLPELPEISSFNYLPNLPSIIGTAGALALLVKPHLLNRVKICPTFAAYCN